MAIYDPVNTTMGHFAQAVHRHCPRARVYWERSLDDWTTRVAIRGLQPGNYPLQVFHPNGTFEEHDLLPIRFDLHDHGCSEIYTKVNDRWWNSALQPLDKWKAKTQYRTLQLIL